MNETAFVIEDDEDLSTIFTEALQSAGYQVERLLDGAAARQRLSETAPHLVLLDMHLPHVSGADLLTGIRSDERFARTLVVIATADARLGEEYRSVADFVLIKPISFVQLRDLTQRLHKPPAAA
ncbi:MAG: putative two-component response regulator [Anaerolineaceae bacterium]|nr:MAG: putative two-component response regulator [Anaerolineaceae bacterium]